MGDELTPVIPAKAGIQKVQRAVRFEAAMSMDSGFRRNDGLRAFIPIMTNKLDY